jgi:hypothetical protein
LSEEERRPGSLIKEGAFEKIDDFTYNGVLVPASRLGYRMTEVFSYKYLGKIFDEPQTVFNENILKPESQSMEAFVDGVINISNGHKKAAFDYFEDGSIEFAIPPLKALLNIMAYGVYEGHTIESKEIRGLFDKNVVLSSEWYEKRLKNKQLIDIRLVQKKIGNLEEFVADPINKSVIKEFRYDEKLEQARAILKHFESDLYLKSLVGTIGAGDTTLK